VDGDYVLIELDRIAVRGRAEESAIHTILASARASTDQDASGIAALHARLLTALRAGEKDEAAGLIEQCRRLAPALASYYARLPERFSGKD
jgi:hypothetical protein